VGVGLAFDQYSILLRKCVRQLQIMIVGLCMSGFSKFRAQTALGSVPIHQTPCSPYLRTLATTPAMAVTMAPAAIAAAIPRRDPTTDFHRHLRSAATLVVPSTRPIECLLWLLHALFPRRLITAVPSLTLCRRRLKTELLDKTFL